MDLLVLSTQNDWQGRHKMQKDILMKPCLHSTPKVNKTETNLHQI